LILGRDNLNKIPFQALVNSGSTHCFVDSKFVDTHHLKTSATSPVALCLFNGSSNSTISEIANLPIIFSTGDYMNLDFYVTPLDSSCSLVLGYNWLARYNPLIDWVNGLINFHPSLQENLAPSHIAANTPLASLSFLDTPLQSSDSAVSIPTSETSVSNSGQPNIAIIGTAAFLHTSKLLGSYNFELCLRFSDIQANSAKLAEIPNLSNVPSKYHKFANVFSKIKAKALPPHCPYDLKINLEEGAQPLVGPIYSLSASEQEALKEFIEENLNTGFIRPTSSLHGAPVLFVKKKDGSLHLCVDFRRLNRISKKDRYPLLLISDLLDSPRKARVYSKIDDHHAYHLVCIANGDEWKTAFRTRYGSFEWSVMPFGLTNAPTVFQRFMNDIFSDLLDVCVMIYLDDILIYSNNMSEHHQHVKEVLKCLCKAGLYAKVEKCKFHSESVEYLGYILSPSGLTMSDNKVKIIQDWPEPKKVKDIQSFLGFTNFYHWFIFNYLDIVIPLICLTWKDIPWKFDFSYQDTFNSLKKAFTSTPILTH